LGKKISRGKEEFSPVKNNPEEVQKVLDHSMIGTA